MCMYTCKTSTFIKLLIEINIITVYCKHVICIYKTSKKKPQKLKHTQKTLLFFF